MLKHYKLGMPIERSPITNEPEPNTRAGGALKPCPFCGDDEPMVFERDDFWQITCGPCTCDITERTREQAITAWNTRAQPELEWLGCNAVAPRPQPSELVEWLLALAIDCDETDGWEDAASDVRHAAIHIADLEAQLAKLQADGDKLAGVLVTAMIPIEAILLSGADLAHCQDVRDALHDAKATAPQALTEWKDRA